MQCKFCAVRALVSVSVLVSVDIHIQELDQNLKSGLVPFKKVVPKTCTITFWPV